MLNETLYLTITKANLRAWAKGNGWVKQNSSGGVEQWGVKNVDETFSLRLKIKPQASTREGLSTGSNQPRFDARFVNDCGELW
ncbi:hypothetical protein [Paenibacillus aceti]|uniref:Uncharacterized protein n=1 Tax=Paenibacillus aceti TaxID=1820010 RepID=A0ABQ1VYL3_9BACL|nr:hypothetical protein [Paenibacillus aceti]GGG02512.1 hypothetical protein GCM10010913_25320 [Paenibacillus aceti]